MNIISAKNSVQDATNILNAVNEYVLYSTRGLEGMISTMWGNSDPDALLQCYAEKPRSALSKTLWASQLGQDKLVAGLLDFREGGYFIELGCGNGTIISNTYTLEHFFDWKGLLVEPSPGFCQDMRHTRSSRIVERAITPRSDHEVLNLITGNVYGSCLEPSQADSHAEFLTACKALELTHEVQSISVDSLCRDYGVPAEFDYLSLDIEGGEYDIIRAWPFSRHRPMLLSIEHNYGPTRDAIREFLQGNGYSYFGLGWDDFFVSNDLLDHVKPPATVALGPGSSLLHRDSITTSLFDQMSQHSAMDLEENTAPLRAKLLAASWVLNEQCQKEIHNLREQSQQSLQLALNEVAKLKELVEEYEDQERVAKENRAREELNERNRLQAMEAALYKMQHPQTWRARLKRRLGKLLED